MKLCPHCGQASFSALRVHATPTRLICKACGGASRAVLGPSSVAARTASVVLASILLVFVFRDFGHPTQFFWPMLIAMPLVAIGASIYYVQTQPLVARAAEPRTLREVIAWVASSAGRRALLSLLLVLIACPLWLFLLMRVAVHLRGSTT